MSEPDPAKQKEIINGLTPEQLTKLRKSRNPFKKPVYAPKGERYLAFNILNLREKYYRNFAMTGLIAFLFRMVDEFGQDAEFYQNLGLASGTCKSENDPEFAARFNKKVNRIQKYKPLELLDAELEAIAGDSLEADRAKIVNRVKYYKYKMFLAKRKKIKRSGHYQALRTERDSIVDVMKQTRDVGEKLEVRIAAIKNRISSEKKLEGKSEVKDEKDEKDEVKMDDISKLDQILKNNRDAIEKMREDIAKLNVEKLEHLYKDAEVAYDKLVIEYEVLVDRFHLLLPKVRIDSIKPENYEISEAEIEKCIEETKRELGIADLLEDVQDRARNLIHEFLSTYLAYDPDVHVKRAQNPSYVPPDDRPEMQFIPPADTFHRLDRYVSNNYEAVRAATDAIYHERSDIEWAIAPLEVFASDDKESAMEKFDAFKKKYSNEFEAEVMLASMGQWTLLAPWSENREKIDFYNEHTELIKKIVEANSDDQKMGKKLAKKRAELDKKKNKKEMGEDAATFKRQKSVSAKAAEYYGAKAADFAEPTKDEIKIEGTNIKPKRTGKLGNRIRGIANKYHFNIIGDNPEDVKLDDVATFKKKLQQV